MKGITKPLKAINFTLKDGAIFVNLPLVVFSKVKINTKKMHKQANIITVLLEPVTFE